MEKVFLLSSWMSNLLQKWFFIMIACGMVQCFGPFVDVSIPGTYSAVSPATAVSSTSTTPQGSVTPNRRAGLYKRNQMGETSLHLAAKRGDLEKVKRLIEQGLEVNITDNAGTLYDILSNFMSVFVASFFRIFPNETLMNVGNFEKMKLIKWKRQFCTSSIVGNKTFHVVFFSLQLWKRHSEGFRKWKKTPRKSWFCLVLL